MGQTTPRKCSPPLVFQFIVQSEQECLSDQNHDTPLLEGLRILGGSGSEANAFVLAGIQMPLPPMPQSEGDVSLSSPTIALRDYFAGQVLGKIYDDYVKNCLDQPSAQGSYWSWGDVLNAVAQDAWEVADKMLSTRGTQGTADE